jgi:hypothetical protein
MWQTMHVEKIGTNKKAISDQFEPVVPRMPPRK